MRLDFNQLGPSLNRLCQAYEDAGFNDKAKFGMLRKQVVEDESLRSFLMLKGPKTFTELRESIEIYAVNTEIFLSLSNISTNHPKTVEEVYEGVSNKRCDIIPQDFSRKEKMTGNQRNVNFGVDDRKDQMSDNLKYLAVKTENLISVRTKSRNVVPI